MKILRLGVAQADALFGISGNVVILHDCRAFFVSMSAWHYYGGISHFVNFEHKAPIYDETVAQSLLTVTQGARVISEFSKQSLKLTLINLPHTLTEMPTVDTRTNPNGGDVVEKLQRSRKRLLDLTLRNRLLNFRPGNPNYQDDQKAHKHLVLDGEVQYIWQNLVEQEKQIEVVCLTNEQREQISEELRSLQSDNESTAKPEDGFSFGKLGQEEWENVRDQIRGMAQFRQKGNLLSKLSSKPFRKRLTKIRNEQNTLANSIGDSALFLAVGFLEWCEAPLCGVLSRTETMVKSLADRIQAQVKLQPRSTFTELTNRINQLDELQKLALALRQHSGLTDPVAAASLNTGVHPSPSRCNAACNDPEPPRRKASLPPSAHK